MVHHPSWPVNSHHKGGSYLVRDFITYSLMMISCRPGFSQDITNRKGKTMERATGRAKGGHDSQEPSARARNVLYRFSLFIDRRRRYVIDSVYHKFPRHCCSSGTSSTKRTDCAPIVKLIFFKLIWNSLHKEIDTVETAIIIPMD